MKGILIILDGLGDLPTSQLGDKTPLEAAQTPNMDFFAHRGELGFIYSFKPDFIPGSDKAIVSMFGNELSSSSRGQLEARGTDLKIMRGDLTFRTNFACIDSLKDGNIIDRRIRTLTTKEAEKLSSDLNKIDLSCKFIFKPTIQHRGVLVFKGGFSDNISGNDMAYIQGKSNTNKVGSVKPLDEDENSQYSANVVNEFLEKAYNVLKNHEINQKRIKKGLTPVNYLLVRGPGIEQPKLKFYRKWFSVAYMPLEIGFSRVSGMKVFSFNYPKLRWFDAYSNLNKGLRKACKFSIKQIKRNHKKFDYAYIHIKETDIPGHDNKPVEKKMMIEYIDKTLINFLRKFAPQRNIKVVITGDHSTPCKLKGHSADPVPVLLYSAKETAPKEKRFIEREARTGTLGRIYGKDLLKKVGFV